MRRRGLIRTSQLDTVYGRDYTEKLRDIFPAALIMYGAAYVRRRR